MSAPIDVLAAIELQEYRLRSARLTRELREFMARELCEARIAVAELIADVRTSLDELTDHPLYLGDDATTEEIEREGGDAATITVIAHRLRAALRETQP